jgi:hypothetical protein
LEPVNGETGIRCGYGTSYPKTRRLKKQGYYFMTVGLILDNTFEDSIQDYARTLLIQWQHVRSEEKVWYLDIRVFAEDFGCETNEVDAGKGETYCSHSSVIT